MFCRTIMRSVLLVGVLILGIFAEYLPGEDQPPGKEPEQSKQRLALMEQTVAGFEAAGQSDLPKAALTFGAKPLLRYSDPTRGTSEANVLLDATVWRLGEKGMPTALVTLEIYRASEMSSMLAYEFVSLAEPKFSLSHKQNPKVTWEAAGKAFKMSCLEGAPKPATTATGRLAQMRQLARKFTVKEKLKEEEIECRLLSQPIDRYQSAEEGIIDGGLFAFANGTRPR